AIFNGTRGDPHSFDLLDIFLNAQAYRLAFWRVAADEINYRRFFAVNDLAALSTERPRVFAATHALIFRLLEEGKITSLRIDHANGLYDPKEFLERLQQHFVLQQARQIAAAHANFPEEESAQWQETLFQRMLDLGPKEELRRPLYVLVEKILGKDEVIPEDW